VPKGAGFAGYSVLENSFRATGISFFTLYLELNPSAPIPTKPTHTVRALNKIVVFVNFKVALPSIGMVLLPCVEAGLAMEDASHKFFFF
jgi:hypothetical protein